MTLQDKLEKKGIYVFTFPNGCKYIGCVTGEKQSFTKRFNEHLKVSKNEKHPRYDLLLYRAIRNYGFDNIDKKILLISDCKQYIFDMERELITTLQLNRKRFPDGIGYNLTDGGEGCRTKMTMLSHKITIKNLETNEEITDFRSNLVDNGLIGRDISRDGYSRGWIQINPEPKIKRNRVSSSEFRKEISNRLKGKQFSAEHRNNISKSRIGKFVGENNPLYGRKMSQEQKEKQKQSHKFQQKFYTVLNILTGEVIFNTANYFKKIRKINITQSLRHKNSRYRIFLGEVNLSNQQIEDIRKEYQTKSKNLINMIEETIK